MTTCATCRHAHQTDGTLLCRRFPPHTSILMAVGFNPLTNQKQQHPQAFAAWPPVQPDQGCGEHVPNLILSN